MASLSRTGVPWVVNPPDNEGPGFSWNPITGCLKRCEWCYAHALAKGRLREPYLANDQCLPGPKAWLDAQPMYSNAVPPAAYDDAFWPRWWQDRLFAPIHRQKPSGIFVVNMGDLFGPWVPRRMIDGVLDVIQGCPQHRFYFLTKFPERLREFNPWPANAWVGATATDFESFVGATLHLGAVEVQMRYISLEPLLDWPGLPVVDTLRALCINTYKQLLDVNDISWLIVGPCNGPLAKQYPCDPRWLEGIGAACDAAGVAVFEKPECARLGLGRPLRREFPL
ncbi:MAG: DUF5131 family protein [Dehalococcoidia bacterium]